MADNLDWLYDYLLQFLKSPGWRVPILNFIDQFCYQFEDSSENKLVYTEIHAKFKELIDSLLENLCITIGISQEQFLKVCEKGILNPSHKRVFEQMLACDNFISFKKLMLKRNKELELEAAKHNEKNVAPKVNEEAEIELARTLSLKDHEERNRLEDKYNEELRLAMKLSEEEFKAHLNAMKEIEEAGKRKDDIFKQAEDREQARLQALKEEADKVLRQKLEEEQKLEELRKEEMRIKKMIEDRKLEEMRKSEVDNTELREKELHIQIKLAEAERLAKEAEAQKLQNEQFEMLRKIQEAEERRRVEAAELEEKRKRKEEKLKEKERTRQQEEEKRRDEYEKQRLTIKEEEKKIELEKERLREEAKRVDEERQRLEAEKQEKIKRKLEKQRLQEEKKRKDEEEKLKSLELEERKKIEEETEKIQRLQNENKKLEEIMSLKKKENAKRARAKKMKQEEEVKIQLGPESSLGFKNYEKELNFDEAVESEIRRVQDSAIRQQENEVAGKVRSSLPPIHGKMGLMTGISVNVENVVESPEKKGPETLAEREARLKAQRDALVEAKKKKREEAHNEYIQEGGVDLEKKATPAVSNDELEKRKQILMKIKTYSEENDN